jgi:hypothetical protein
MRELNDSETTTIIYISIFTIFFISLISCMGYKYDKNRNSITTGEIIEINNIEEGINSIKIIYEIHNENYIQNFRTTSLYEVGSKISLYYDENNIENIDLYKDRKQLNILVIPYICFWLILIGIVFYLCT